MNEENDCSIVLYEKEITTYEHVNYYTTEDNTVFNTTIVNMNFDSRLIHDQSIKILQKDFRPSVSA